MKALPNVLDRMGVLSCIGKTLVLQGRSPPDASPETTGERSPTVTGCRADIMSISNTLFIHSMEMFASKMKTCYLRY